MLATASSASKASPNVALPAATRRPIYLRYGSVLEGGMDLAVAGPKVSWAQSRTYDSGQAAKGETQMGNMWSSSNGDYRLVQQDGGSVSLLVSASSRQDFTCSDGVYTASFDSTLRLQKQFRLGRQLPLFLADRYAQRRRKDIL